MKLLNKLLLPIAFEDDAKKIIQTGRELHDMFHSQLILLHVLPERLNKQDIGELVKSAARENLNGLKKQLHEAGVEDVEVILEQGNVFDKILDTAEEHEVNAILMGPGRGKPSKPNNLGITVEKVIRKTSIPVWVVRQEDESRLNNILCPVDFSEASQRALENAIMLAGKYDARLHILSVFEPDVAYSRWIKADLEDTNRQSYKELKIQFKEFLKKFDFGQVQWEKVISQGSVDGEILNYVRKQNIDLLVMGTVGRTGLSRILIGSVAEKVIREAPCSVITTKSKSMLDFRFEAKMAELEKHHKAGLDALNQNDLDKALTHFILAHQEDTLHIPTLIRLYQIYQKQGKESKANLFKKETLRVLDSLWDKKMADTIRKHYGLE